MARLNNQAQDKYIDQVFATEDSEIKQIREALKKDQKEGINIGPAEGKTLQLLIHLIQAKKIVEVGLLYGYSTLWMAKALPREGEIHSIEFNPDNFHQAQKLLTETSEYSKINLYLGDAQEVLPTLNPKGPFDLVFIDANKSAYPEYLSWAELNVRPGGLIVGDNTFLFGHVYSQGRTDVKVSQKQVQAMLEFNQRLSDSSKFNSILIPTDEGMTIAQKKF